MDFAKTSGNLKPLQSAYRAAHSMETAMLKVKTDLFNAIEDKKVMCLVLLDLSAAFDTESSFTSELSQTLLWLQWKNYYMAVQLPSSLHSKGGT